MLERSALARRKVKAAGGSPGAAEEAMLVPPAGAGAGHSCISIAVCT